MNSSNIDIIDNSDIWKIIHSHFEENPQSLVRHHIESYNDFLKTGIFKIFKDKNQITIHSVFDEKINDYRHQCTLYFGGKQGNKIYFGKPVIYDNENPHYMFPNEARLRNMNYEMTIHYDVDVECINILELNQAPYPIESYMVGGIQKENEKEYLGDEDDNADRKDEINYHLNGGDIMDEEETAGGAKEGKPNERKRRYKTVGVADVDAVADDKINTDGMTVNEAAEFRENLHNTINGRIQTRTFTLNKLFLGKIPIMVQSDYCILNNLSRNMRHSMGECRNDPGGYFIIGGKEKTVVTQETEARNMLSIKKVDNEDYLYSADIVSVSENVSKPVRILKVGLKTPSKRYSNLNIVVTIPNVKNPVPLFIVFRALGIISDKDIITMCLLDIDKYESFLELFRPSVHDAGGIMTQQSALKYIATLTKYGSISYAMEILTDFFLPHIGEINYIQKAYYLGYMVFRLLSVYIGIELPTDRDNLKFKRVELVGSLLNDLFREYYTLQQKEIHLLFEKKLYYDKNFYAENLPELIYKNYHEAFRERVIDMGIKKAFKGNWGSQSHTKRIGVVQDLNRLSFNSMISHLRKTNLHLDAGLKLVGPRVLTNSQWGFFDPIDTPDGGNIGLHKTLAIATYVSRGYSREPMIKWLREKIAMKLPEECPFQLLAKLTKVMVNGLWAGSIENPIENVEKMKLFRRNALIPIHTSITFDIPLNTIFIYTDEGRLCRPIFYKNKETNKFSFENKEIFQKIHDNAFVWDELITGFNKKKIPAFLYNTPAIYELHELYEGITSESNPARLDRFLKDMAIIDYIDPSESEHLLIALNTNDLKTYTNKKYTHLEIHESLTYGIMCNQTIFLENNPVVRNSFSCGQSKQAVSMYHTNHQVRMDKTAVVLNYGQIPLVKSRYMEHINHEENPYGENAIVAIMCYTGYNVEDAVLINEGAIKRGMFNTTYYTVYESHEETTKSESVSTDTKFTNTEKEPYVVGQKVGYDYSQLDNYGIIKENVEVNDKTILIGLTSSNPDNKEIRMDMSKEPKKGQLGIVDKSFITDGEEGERIAKVRIREIRIPNLGDKMASRSGQKGTVGMVIPESDMPFTKDGIRPDIIINPHAIPTRMTIGQLVECITGKVCAMYGGFGDCTPFNNNGSKIGIIGEQLCKAGFHSSGNDILYNGMTGEQIESDIFIGPTYYMRLKHMVKDKINYRAAGPRTALTRQPVSGRANDGGLRIGEMERDVLISHGMNNMLSESMMERGDKYYIAICNQTGMIAAFNPSKNIFISPMADGPIQYTGEINGSTDFKNMNVIQMTRFGRNFSVVCVPYSFKLLLQELQAMNIQMRIITEDNIKQIENLAFSKNIDKLTHMPNTTLEDIKTTMKELMNNPNNNPIAMPYHGTPIFKLTKEDEVVNEALPVAVEEYKSPEYKSPEYPSPELPDGWIQKYSDKYQREYYYNTTTQESVWEKPVTGGRGEKEKKKDYKLGDIVFYAGDAKMGRQWVIKDYTNTNDIELYTISTNDISGESNIHDTIKVVRPNELYGPDDIIPSNYVHTQPPAIPHMMDTVSSHMTPTPAIEMNPVFNIVTAPNSSINTHDAPQQQAPINPDFKKNIVINPAHHNISNASVSIGNSDSSVVAPAEDASKEIDFSKAFVIKKV